MVLYQARSTSFYESLQKKWVSSLRIAKTNHISHRTKVSISNISTYHVGERFGWPRLGYFHYIGAAQEFFEYQANESEAPA